MAEQLPGRNEATAPTVDISDDIARFAEMGVPGRLLKDRSTGRSIIWASDVFVDKGESYAPSDEILPADITADNADLISTGRNRFQRSHVKEMR